MPNRLLGKTDKMGPFRSMIYLFKMVMFNGYYDYYVKSQQRYVETCRDINYIYICVCVSQAGEKNTKNPTSPAEHTDPD